MDEEILISPARDDYEQTVGEFGQARMPAEPDAVSEL